MTKVERYSKRLLFSVVATIALGSCTGLVVVLRSRAVERHITSTRLITPLHALPRTGSMSTIWLFACRTWSMVAEMSISALIGGRNLQ